MNDQDEKLQHLAEKGILDTTSQDSIAYHHVLKAIREEPTYELPSNFSEKVILRIRQIQESRSMKKDLLWLCIGLSSFVVAAIVSIAITDFKFNSGVFTFFNKYGGLVLFGIAFVIILQWIDHKMVQVKNNKNEYSY